MSHLASLSLCSHVTGTRSARGKQDKRTHTHTHILHKHTLVHTDKHKQQANSHTAQQHHRWWNKLEMNYSPHSHFQPLCKPRITVYFYSLLCCKYYQCALTNVYLLTKLYKKFVFLLPNQKKKHWITVDKFCTVCAAEPQILQKRYFSQLLSHSDTHMKTTLLKANTDLFLKIFFLVKCSVCCSL